MFKKILIANRGEIACRIIKTARTLGIETVAIYSSADVHSLHVQAADSAYWVGEAAAAVSYLNIEAIIAIALETGSEAIHPGYGFLSENTEFAKACHKAGIVFIGPSIAAMEAMASKQLAKQRLEKTQVPLTPGYHGKDQSEKRLIDEACHIGFPVLLKAAAGGGGKGMRAVHTKSDFTSALAGARREALAYFADDTMIIEKFVKKPRHIEIQIMADNFGAVVHLFERDCSIQRRHQKIIEEAPAANLSASLRQRISQSACEVARSIQYRGAGTVEFLVAEDEQFYFMEMNTRLQVEHPVTEMITGVDLVAWQLRIAANEALPCRQDEIKAQGHAIECRIYAEDPNCDFMPSIGTLRFLREPSGPGIRLDSGVTEGSVISQYYDPMMAKLISFGDTREQALARLQQALKHYAIGGVISNIPFLQAICAHPAFIAVKYSVDFLENETLQFPKVDPILAALMAASYDYLCLRSEECDPLLKQSFAWQMHLNSSWRWQYHIGTEELELEIHARAKDQLQVTYQGQVYTLQAECRQQALIMNDGQGRYRSWYDTTEEAITFYTENGPIMVARKQWQAIEEESCSSAKSLTAPMPATIVAILKNLGEHVEKNEPLMILEAMKMEHTIHAPKSGILAEFFYKMGEQVSEGAELLRLDE